MSDSVTTTVAVPVGSAGRVGMRQGQVSELTGILPLKPGGADRLRGKLAEDPPTRTPSCGTCTAASGSPRPSMRYSTHPRSEIQPVPAVLRYARNTKPPTQKRTPCFSRGSALTGRGEGSRGDPPEDWPAVKASHFTGGRRQEKAVGSCVMVTMSPRFVSRRLRRARTRSITKSISVADRTFFIRRWWTSCKREHSISIFRSRFARTSTRCQSTT